jgi:hypothetical protein
MPVLDSWEQEQDVATELLQDMRATLGGILSAIQDLSFKLGSLPPPPPVDLSAIVSAIERAPAPPSLDPVVASLGRLERDMVQAANNSTLLLTQLVEATRTLQTAATQSGPSRYVAVGGGASMATTESLLARLPDLTGTWGYYAGVSGTVVMAAGQRVTGIAAHATLAGSMTINAGASITIPADTGIWLEPQGQLVAPTLVFTGTDTYVVEYLT